MEVCTFGYNNYADIFYACIQDDSDLRIRRWNTVLNSLYRVYPVHQDLGFLRALCIGLNRSNH